MRITFTVHTPNKTANDDRTCKQVVGSILANALEQFSTTEDIVLVSGNPARTHFETTFGESVTIKVARR
jgi:hypothetical protein